VNSYTTPLDATGDMMPNRPAGAGRRTTARRAAEQRDSTAHGRKVRRYEGPGVFQLSVARGTGSVLAVREGPGQTWKLYQGDKLLADLVVTGGDFPWLNARVEAYCGFEDVRPLFAEELRVVEDINDETDAWQAAYDAIRTTLTLRYPDGAEVPEFLLHIDGHEAWWRWSDEPFDDAAKP